VVRLAAELALGAGEGVCAIVQAGLLHPPTASLSRINIADTPRLARLAIPSKGAALCELGAGEAGAPEAAREDEGLEGRADRARGVRWAWLAVVGRGFEDVGRVGARLQVESRLADGAGDAASAASKRVGAGDALALALVGGVSVGSALVAGRAAGAGGRAARAPLADALSGEGGEGAWRARRLLGGAGGGKVARRGVDALRGGGEVRLVRVGTRVARQWRRRALGAVPSLLAVAAGRRARVVLITARRAVRALTQPGLAAKRPSTAARAGLAADCAGGRARGSDGALLASVG